MGLPLFPKCYHQLVHSAWFEVDPCSYEEEISQLEKEHSDWLEAEAATKAYSDLPPIGKTSSEAVCDDDEEEEEDNDDDDDDSESHDDDEEEDEIEMEAANN